MSFDPVNPANEPGAFAEPQPSATGFDVNAAAAGVRAELAPAAPGAPGPWTAADYGWDPSDANAVAWAAYYSELGVDPTTLAAQQAAEAAAAQPAVEGSAEAAGTVLAPEDAPEPEPTFVSEPALASAPPLAVGPSIELEAPADQPQELSEPAALAEPDRLFSEGDTPLDDLAFAPVHTSDEPDPVAVPADLAPGAIDGGSAIWELMPAEPEAAVPAQLEAPSLPAGWSADERARIDDFQLASGGSFDEPTAPLGDLMESPEGERADGVGDLSPELPPLDLGIGLGDEPANDAASAPGAAPGDAPLPLPDLDLSPAAPELSIDLGFVEDEPAAPPAASAPATPLLFDLDLEAPGAAAAPSPLPSAGEAPGSGPQLEVDLGWAAHAVPAGDGAVDLASFDAEPQLESGPDRPHDGTAMWSLPGRAAAPPAAATALPPAGLLGDAAPLPTPAGVSASAEAGELGEPVDGSLFLEPVQDSAESALAPAPDPWDAPAPPAVSLDLAPESGAGPFDLGVPEEPPPAEPAEAILEVGEEVIEISSDGLDAPAEQAAAIEPLEAAPEPSLPVAAPPTPEPPAAPPRAEAESLPVAALLGTGAPEPVPAAPAPSGPAAAASPPPSCFIAGSHRVVVHTSDGQVKRGTLLDAALDGPQLQLRSQPGDAPEPLAAERVKAIFFMLATGEAPPAPEGKKVRVTFRDGRQVAGFSPDYAPERVGFFMVPSDTRTHTARIWVYRASVRQVTVSP